MSESILKALIQLFALISDVNDDTGISSRGRDIVKLFLARQLNNELVLKYLAMFDDYLRLYHQEHISKGTLKERKRTSLTATRILSKCEQINEELHQRQKIFVMVQLMDFIFFSGALTEQELDFLGLVATAFNIEASEYENIKAFVLGPENEEPEKNRLMIIDSRKSCDREDIKHIYIENLKGRMLFLHIVSANTLIMRYSGGEDLFLNGQNIFPGRTYVFDHGSSIRGSGIETVYYNDVAGVFTEEAFKLRVSLDARDISLSFRNSDSGLQKLNFHEESGKLVAIMGGSGVGKSTLMNILSGVTEPDTGEVTINGYNLYSPDERDYLKGVIGFVPQDDLLFEELTVWQNLYYNARMCLDNLSEERLREAVYNILDDFDLTEIKDLKVGNYLNKVISGGQRKRLNIALELIREPTILFVDEPTSGLSSADAEVVMNILKAQTYMGRLVIVSIHQPGSDIYKMFNSVVIIDKGGYMIFYGNPTEAVVWFKTRANHANALEDQCVSCGNVNTDQLLQIIESKVVNEDGKPTHIRKVTPAEWAEAFSEEATKIAREKKPEKSRLPENNYSIPPLLRQSRIFFMRDLLSKLADTQYILISLLGAPLLAFLLAYFTKDRSGEAYNFSLNENLPAYMFMCVITAFFLGLIISAEEIVKDRKILKRESFLNLSWFSYINSKVFMMFLFSAIQTLSFILIGNLILGIRDVTAVYWAVLFTTSCLANMIGLNISSAMNSVVTIYILIPFILIPQLLFSGVLVKFDKLHKNDRSNYEYVPVIGDLMPARWSFEALAVEQFRNNRYEKNFFMYDAEISQNNWYASFLVDALRENSYECRKYRDSLKYSEIIDGNFRKLGLYTDQLARLAGFGPLPGELALSLNRERFSPATADRIDSYLDSLARKFHGVRKNNIALKDSVTRSLIESMGKDEFLAMKENYSNRKLREILLDEFTIKKTIETRDRIIQRFEPVYMKPVSRNGRAQFYVSYKQLGNVVIETFWFNISVLWIVTLIFYMLLNFDVLRKAVNFGFRIKLLRRKERKPGIRGA
jgi:ABC-type multidrug transport system ATPase subunit